MLCLLVGFNDKFYVKRSITINLTAVNTFFPILENFLIFSEGRQHHCGMQEKSRVCLREKIRAASRLQCPCRTGLRRKLSGRRLSFRMTIRRTIRKAAPVSRGVQPGFRWIPAALFSREPSANDFLTARGEPRGRRIAYQEEAGGDISALRQFTQYIRRKERMLPGGAQSRSRFRVSFFMDMDSRGRDRPARSCRAPAMFCKA